MATSVLTLYTEELTVIGMMFKLGRNICLSDVREEIRSVSSLPINITSL